MQRRNPNRDKSTSAKDASSCDLLPECTCMEGLKPQQQSAALPAMRFMLSRVNLLEMLEAASPATAAQAVHMPTCCGAASCEDGQLMCAHAG